MIGFVGAGNYASRMLIPAFRKAGAELRIIASAGGTSGVVHGSRAGFAEATSDSAAVLFNAAVDAVVVATRHNSHARFAAEALAAGKSVFVEKPLALTLEELAAVEHAFEASNGMLMVGFNRRFAPLVQKMKQLLGPVREPKSFVAVMNAGAIPAAHWTQDRDVGGGRIIGEACHHIDLLRYLAGAPIVSIQVRRIQIGNSAAIAEDKAVIVLGFADGSFGTIHYLANGGPSFPKERVEVFAGGGTLQLDNFLKLRGFNWRGFRKETLWRQDKGQSNCAAAFLEAVEKGGEPPIPADQLFEIARVSIEAADALRAQQ